MAKGRGKDKKPRKQRKKIGYAVAFKNRRTYSLTDASSREEAIRLTRASKRRGGDEVVEVRKMTPSEVKTAQAGRWVRSRPKGFAPEDRGSGPPSGAFLRSKQKKNKDG